MSDQVCIVDQDLCPVTVGDTVPFDYEFTLPDGSPMDISGMTLVFYVSLNPDYNSIVVQQATTFPAGSTDGMGGMKILPETTNKLTRGQCYFFKFVLENGPEDVFTVGSGKWEAK